VLRVRSRVAQGVIDAQTHGSGCPTRPQFLRAQSPEADGGGGGRGPGAEVSWVSSTPLGPASCSRLLAYCAVLKLLFLLCCFPRQEVLVKFLQAGRNGSCLSAITGHSFVLVPATLMLPAGVCCHGLVTCVEVRALELAELPQVAGGPRGQARAVVGLRMGRRGGGARGVRAAARSARGSGSAGCGSVIDRRDHHAAKQAS
jgi:hypothetical protein